MELHGQVAARLRQAGLRYTSGRRKVVDVILAADRPVTTAEVVALSPELPQSTAYRNLSDLEHAGVVHRVRGGDEFARFELSEELGGHHHHLVCSRCGTVADFTPPAPFEHALADVISTVTKATRFRVDSHRLDVVGVCDACI